ncbi:sugar kinase [Ideonella sp.]|uniref:sugar kinase n=1 Tax=Ideonella sp. TaxID=1929293 RepID=UPI003BB6D4D7
MNNPQPHGVRVAAFGECMLELQGPPFGPLHQGFGGDTLNTAVYLARCGQAARVQVSYATALGDGDPFSTGLLRRWHAEGLDTALVRHLPGRLPGLYHIEVDEAGERRFHYWRDRAAARDYFDAEPGCTPLEQQQHSLQALYFSGISLAILPPEGRARLLAVARAVRDRGGLVAFDNNYRPRLWPDRRSASQAFDAATAVCTLALMTLDDELALSGLGDVDAQVRQTLALPVAEVVIKRGAEPTLVRSAEGALHTVPTTRVERVTDTTAAGDSFAGAYLAARLSGSQPAQAADAGNRLAARVVQHRGAILTAEAMQGWEQG